MSREEAGRRKAGSTPGCGRQEKADREAQGRIQGGGRHAGRRNEEGRE